MLFNVVASTAVSAIFLAQEVAAATHRVDVGFNGTAAAQRFSPDVTTAAPGDVVEFYFHAGNHNVVSGSFATPCSQGNISTFFNSGFNKVAAGEGSNVFSITVNNTNPIWLYCAQVGPGTTPHCKNGMVAAINPKATVNTLDAYRAAAALTNSSANVFPNPLVGTNTTVTNGTTTTAPAPTNSGTSTGSSGSTGTTTGSGAAATTSRPSEAGRMRWDMMAGVAALAGVIAMVL